MFEEVGGGGRRGWLRYENGHSICPKGFGVGAGLVKRLWGVGSTRRAYCHKEQRGLLSHAEMEKK